MPNCVYLPAADSASTDHKFPCFPRSSCRHVPSLAHLLNTRPIPIPIPTHTPIALQRLPLSRLPKFQPENLDTPPAPPSPELRIKPLSHISRIHNERRLATILCEIVNVDDLEGRKSFRGIAEQEGVVVGDQVAGAVEEVDAEVAGEGPEPFYLFGQRLGGAWFGGIGTERRRLEGEGKGGEGYRAG